MSNTSLDKEDSDEESGKKEEEALTNVLMIGASEVEIRTVSVMGDICEEICKDVISGLWYLKANAVDPDSPASDDEESEVAENNRPIEMLISTHGGSADDMFAIYDAMRYIRETVDIETFGLGKVMSAGTLLLAAGTKGKRKIGKHCRVMIHSVIGGSVGPMHQLDNEMKEVKAIQESYIRAICDETNLTERKLRSLLKKKVNIYLTAPEAVEYGFADIIV